MFIQGKDLKKIRKFGGITSEKMAKVVGVKTRKTISNWEKNISEPSINQFLSICIGCGVDCHRIVQQIMQRKHLHDDLII